MSSNVLQAIKNLRKNLHNVGSLNNWSKKVLNQGAKVATAAIDNFELVELDFNTAGERICKSLPNSTTKGYLVATPEDYMSGYESISSFFNDIGEMARIVKLEEGMRFECSNFVGANTDLATKPIKNGMKAHYDHSTKKFKISNNGSDDSAYGTAANQFIVVDANCVSIDGQPIIRFEVTK